MDDVLQGRDQAVRVHLSLMINWYNELVRSMVPYPISDSIWLANGSLLVGAGHHMFLFGQSHERSAIGGAPLENLFEYAARHNGPLEDYHPQMLLQCLLWGPYAIYV